MEREDKYIELDYLITETERVISHEGAYSIYQINAKSLQELERLLSVFRESNIFLDFPELFDSPPTIDILGYDVSDEDDDPNLKDYPVMKLLRGPCGLINPNEDNQILINKN